MSLDYPDMDPVGTDGSITYGDFGPAREEVQKASGLDCKNYNIEISVFNGKMITKGILSEDGKIIFSWGKFKGCFIISIPVPLGLKPVPNSKLPFKIFSCSKVILSCLF